MATSDHQRSDSSDTSSSGSSYQLILDHILTYPGSYEIPLRSMYALNCAPRGQPIHIRSNTPSSAGSSPLTAHGTWYDDKTSQTFAENLISQMSQLSSQPTSLPPSFVTSFVRKCFPSELLQVDFPQALTGLDYLKDLERRRRGEVAEAMSRLGIDRKTLGSEGDSLASRYPGVAQWVNSIEEKERKIDALYTQLYVGLRRWILINELSLLPFNKHNCVAMLNTLYPPVIRTPPTSRLTPFILKQQRDGFFKYIQSVEKSGPRVLGTLMQQGKAPNDENGWAAVTRTLGMYLQLSNSMIGECADILNVQDVSPRKHRISGGSIPSRKADSGISFGGSDRPSIRGSSGAEPSSPIETIRPKTPSGGRSGTALEKIARGLKTIGRSKTDVTEMVPEYAPSMPAQKPKIIRKMRSMGAIEGRNGSNLSLSTGRNGSVPGYDVVEMRRQRMKYEASVA